MTAPTTLNGIFFGAEERYRGRPAVMRVKRAGSWRDIPFDTLLARVQHVCCALRELGLDPGDRIAILSENRPEWAVVDYACLAARLTDVPIYLTLTASQTAYILRDAGAKGVFVSNRELLEKVLEVHHELPDLKYIILFDGESTESGVISLADFEASGAAAATRYPNWRADAMAAAPDDLATLIYTSGTTGEPKGVMLSHGNITSNVVSALQVLPIGASDECLSFLPLCHSFERMVGHFTMVQAGAIINYATSVEAAPAEMVEVRPTILGAVPRLYEKIYAAVVAKATSGGTLSRVIFTWAREVGDARLTARLAGRRGSIITNIAYRIADVLVFAKLRARLGGRIKFAVSGGAPLNADICRFFLSAGITIFEGYGLTETSPVLTANSFAMLKPGTVGRPIPGIELRIAEDGEILARGPSVMKGYFHKPEATAEAIDHDGWFHTGDVGEIDSDGCLRITDRKKDLIKTSGGKYIAPQPIEGMLKTNKFFSNAVMLGDRRQFPIMLLVPNFQALDSWLVDEKIAKGPPQSLIDNAQVRAKLEGEARKSLRDLAHFEAPKKFLLLAHDFTIESGELTPTMKVRRRVVEKNYADQIEELYAGL